VLTYASGVADGDSTITHYRLRWDAGDATVAVADFTEKATLVPSQSLQTITNIVKGTVYRFTVVAINIYGESYALSEVRSVKAYDTPRVPDPVSTAWEASGSGNMVLTVTWPPSAYTITDSVIKVYSPKHSHTYIEDPTFCDGSNADFLAKQTADASTDPTTCTVAFTYLMQNYDY